MYTLREDGMPDGKGVGGRRGAPDAAGGAGPHQGGRDFPQPSGQDAGHRQGDAAAPSGWSKNGVRMTGLKPALEAGRFPGETVVEKDFFLGTVGFAKKGCH